MFGAILGAVLPALIGGVVSRNNNRSNQQAVQQHNQATRKEFLMDRNHSERREDNLTADERAYAEGITAKQQQIANQNADLAAATRGVDFQKMRDQAQAAGFNPLSVMGTAGMYSTEVNRGLGGLAMGGGGGGVAIGGNGYQREFQPSLSAGSFVTEALERGVDTYFNTPPATDPLADALRTALSTNDVVADKVAENYSRPFGYSLSEVAPYTPPRSLGGPAVPAAGKADPSPSDDQVNPSQNPIKFHGRDFAPSGQYSDAETGESRYGEIAGEVLGLNALIHDLGTNARKAFDFHRYNSRGTFVDKYEKPPMATSRQRNSNYYTIRHGGPLSKFR